MLTLIDKDDSYQAPAFPEHLIDPRRKDREWCLAFLRAAYYEFSTLGKGCFYGRASKYQEIKDYAQGVQGTNKYKSLFGIEEVENEAWINIDLSVVPIYPKLRSQALAKVSKSDYTVTATPVDPLAVSAAEREVLSEEVRVRMRSIIAKRDPDIIPYTPLQAQPGDPEDLDELEIYKNFTYKNRHALEAELAIRLVLELNDYDEVRDQLRESLLDFGVAAVREYIDSNGAIKLRPCKIENLIVSPCIYRDFRDRDYIGEIVEMSIADLKQAAQGQLDDDDYLQIARAVAGKYNNHHLAPTNLGQWDSYRNYKVRILDLEWFSVDEYVFKKGRDSRGNLQVSRQDYNKSGEAYQRKAYKVVYKGRWIIDTPYVYDCGLATNMKRLPSKLMDTKDGYHLFAPNFYDMRIKSIGERAIPLIDGFQLAWYRLQHLIANAKPPGYAIDLSAIEDIPLGKGGKSLDPVEVLDIFNQKGWLIYRRFDLMGQPTHYVPIHRLDHNVGNQLQEIMGTMNNYLNMIRELLGLNEMTANNPDPRSLTTSVQQAYENTQDALFEIIDGERKIFKSLCEGVLARVQHVLRYGRPVEGYVTALGNETVRFFRAAPDLSNHEFGIIIQDIPTENERQELLAKADYFVQQGLLDIEDVNLIRSAHNMKMAEAVLGYKVKKRRRDLQAEEQQRVLLNGQVAQANAQAEAQAKQATIELEKALEAKNIQLEWEWRYKIAMLHAQTTMQTAQLAGETKMYVNNLQADSREYMAQLKSEDEKLAPVAAQASEKKPEM